MYSSEKHRVEDRIVSIHQPHVRPIVRGKAQAKVEFGSKIHVSVIDGISFVDELSWDAFNEGSRMEMLKCTRSVLDFIRGKFWRIGFTARAVIEIC
jgi:hypothetical protein